MELTYTYSTSKVIYSVLYFFTDCNLHFVVVASGRIKRVCVRRHVEAISAFDQFETACNSAPDFRAIHATCVLVPASEELSAQVWRTSSSPASDSRSRRHSCDRNGAFGDRYSPASTVHQRTNNLNERGHNRCFERI